VYLLFIAILVLLPFQYVVVLPGGVEAVRVLAVLLGLGWLIGYLSDPRNRGRMASKAPWLFAGTIAATAIAVPFGVDPAASVVRWGRFVVLWAGFLVAVPAALDGDRAWRRAALCYLAAGAVFGLLNYSEYMLAPASLAREIAANPTGFVIRNAFAFEGGAAGHGHEVGHFASFAILLGLGLVLSARARVERGLLIGLLVIATGALLISFTKSAWAGLGVGVMAFYWRALRRTPLGERVVRVVRWSWLPILVIVSLAAGFWFALPAQTRGWLMQNFLFGDVSGLQRLVLWKGALRLALDHPLVGVGLNSVRLVTGDPHNWWLELLAEGGPLALVCAAACFWRLWRVLAPGDSAVAHDVRMIRGAAAATVMSIAFQGLFEASFLWDFPTWVALGLATAVAGWPAPRLTEDAPAMAQRDAASEP
jgi:O-antigen ligase